MGERIQKYYLLWSDTETSSIKGERIQKYYLLWSDTETSSIKGERIQKWCINLETLPSLYEGVHGYIQLHLQGYYSELFFVPAEKIFIC